MSIAPKAMPLTNWRYWWRGFAQRRHWVRRPVSPYRERAGLVVLAAILLGLATYSIRTRDEAIRRRAIDFLKETTSCEVQVRRARFGIFQGIELNDVTIAVPYNRKLDPDATEMNQRKIFSAKSLKLMPNPWRLLFGQFVIEEIVATKPVIRLVQNVDTGKRNWHLLSGTPAAARASKAGARPEIRLRSAKARLVSVHADGRREFGEEELDADVLASTRSPTGYCIEVRRFSEPAERTTVLFDPGQRLVTNTPFVDASTVRLQLPKTMQAFFDRVKLRGLVKLDRLVYDAQSPRVGNTEVRLRDVRAAIPLSMLHVEPEARPAEPDAAIDMTDVEGRVRLEGARTHFEIDGRVNDGACQVKGWLERDTESGRDIAMDLTITGIGVPFPTGALRERIRSDAAVPDTLRAIFQDYEPFGLSDLAFHLALRPDSPDGLRIDGALRPQGARAKCTWFPYVLTSIMGEVLFEPPKVLVRNVTARHGGGAVAINAKVDRSTEWADVTVDVSGRNIPLDDDLHEALSDEYRRVWDRFAPVGSADLEVKLRRPGAGEGSEAPAWDSHVEARFHDVAITFQDYPYPLEHVAGLVEFTADRIKVRELIGRHGDAIIKLTGEAALNSPPGEGEFTLDAQDMKLDDALADALPPEGRAAFRQFRPEGLANLSGQIRIHPISGKLTYDLRSTLRDAAICYEQFPFRIDQVAGEIRILPDAVSVIEMKGRHGPTQVGVSGRVRRLRDGAIADLDFEASDLALDNALYLALPPALKNAWDVLKPRGVVTAKTSLHYVTRQEESRERHRTQLTIRNATACFRGLPLPLHDVSADVTITNERVQIDRLEGRAGGGTVELRGMIDLDGPGQRGTLSLAARDCRIDDALLSALPRPVREALASIQPSGRFGLDLDPLVFEIDADGKTSWHFSGALHLAGAGCELGLTMKKLSGSVRGQMSVGRDGQVAVDAAVDLARGRISLWQFEQIAARISKRPFSNVVSISDASATAYEGQTTASAQLTIAGGHVDYRASITAREVQLGGFLKAISPDSDSEAIGQIAGNMVLKGRTGSDGYREGTGELFISRAQVWKMPLIFAIFQVLNLTPDENVFHDGWLKFFLSRDEIDFHDIDLHGSALSFTGTGKMHLPDYQLDVLLVAASSSPLRLPILTDLLEEATRELMQIKLTGTVAKPTIRPQPLSGLARAMERLFPRTKTKRATPVAPQKP